MALLGRGVYFTFPFANAAFIGERSLKEKIRYINVVDFMVDLKGYHYMIQRYLKYLYSVIWCQIIFVFEIMTSKKPLCKVATRQGLQGAIIRSGSFDIFLTFFSADRGIHKATPIQGFVYSTLHALVPDELIKFYAKPFTMRVL